MASERGLDVPLDASSRSPPKFARADGVYSLFVESCTDVQGCGGHVHMDMASIFSCIGDHNHHNHNYDNDNRCLGPNWLLCAWEVTRGWCASKTNGRPSSSWLLVLWACRCGDGSDACARGGDTRRCRRHCSPPQEAEEKVTNTQPCRDRRPLHFKKMKTRG